MDVGNSLPGNPLLRIPWIAQMKRMKGDLPLQLDQIQSWTVVRLNCSQKDVTEIYDWTILDLHWWLVLLEAMCRKNDPKILVRLTFKRNTSSTTKHLPNPPFESLASIDEGKPKKTRRIEPSTSPKVVVTEVEKVDRGPSVACFEWWDDDVCQDLGGTAGEILHLPLNLTNDLWKGTISKTSSLRLMVQKSQGQPPVGMVLKTRRK